MAAAQRRIASWSTPTGEVLARATAGPSNPLRAGYAKAWFALSDAADVVLERQHLKAGDIRGICAGIGGAGPRIRGAAHRHFSRTRLSRSSSFDHHRSWPSRFKRRSATRKELSWLWAPAPALTDVTPKVTPRAPADADHGSATKAVRFDIGRRALAAVVRAEENRGPANRSLPKMLKWLGCNDWTRVLDWVVKNPDDVFPRVFPLVAELGDEGDARRLRNPCRGAAESLGESRRERDRTTAHERPRNFRSPRRAAPPGAANSSMPRLTTVCTSSPHTPGSPRFR